jgi:hypothetical protein
MSVAMRTIIVGAVLGAMLASETGAQQAVTPAATNPADTELAGRVRRLVAQLDDARAATRDAAEKELIELAGTTTSQSDKLLELIPVPNEQMPLAVRDRLTRIRQQIEDAAAKAAVVGTKLTLAANQLPLAEAIAAIQKQTGNRLLDKREQFGAAEGGPPVTVTVNVQNEPFWPAIDRLLDSARLGVYNYGGEDGLALIPRGADDGPRFGQAVYHGPFRLEVLQIEALRNLRQPARKSLKLQLEVSWEPRLRPIALSHPVADLSATDDASKAIPVGQPETVLDVEVPTGTQAAELILPFELPAREAKRIASLRGRIKALVPGRQVQFKFDDLVSGTGKTQSRGGVHVTLDAARKNNAIWEVHMRLHLDEANRALESHRGWVFQNISYLVDGEGKRIEQGGFETTRQTPNEVGIAYLFDLPEGKGLEGLAWVYKTPAAIVEATIEYDIKNIDLP